MIKPYNFQFEDVFEVSRIIYGEHEKILARFRKERPHAYADFAAAVFAALYRSGALNDSAVSGLVHLTRTTIMQQGYDEITAYEMRRHAHSVPNVVAIVPGCQNEAMLQRRVARAVDFASDINTPLQIVFAGKHPRRQRINIPNEATRMMNWFKEIAEHKGVDTSKIELRRSDRERNSTDTVSNLNNILGGDEFINKSQRNLLVVISSTFHLIRLGQHLNKCINADKFGVKAYVDRIALVGAESPNDALDTKVHHPYMKLMAFELYHAHMK